MITQTNVSVPSSAVSAVASVLGSDESAEILAHFHEVISSLKTQPLRVLPSASRNSADRGLAQQMQREGFIL